MMKTKPKTKTTTKKITTEKEKKLQNATDAAIEVRAIISGISNAAFTPQAVVNKSAPKPANKPVAKPVAKAEKLPKVAKPEPKVSAKPSDKVRPSLEKTIIGVLEKEGKSMTSAGIFNALKPIADKGGYEVWSRQAIANTLKKKPKVFSQVGKDKDAFFGLAGKVDDKEVQAFIEKSDKNGVAAQVM
jgi:hypothetical protein